MGVPAQPPTSHGRWCKPCKLVNFENINYKPKSDWIPATRVSTACVSYKDIYYNPNGLQILLAYINEYCHLHMNTGIKLLQSLPACTWVSIPWTLLCPVPLPRWVNPECLTTSVNQFGIFCCCGLSHFHQASLHPPPCCSGPSCSARSHLHPSHFCCLSSTCCASSTVPCIMRCETR